MIIFGEGITPKRPFSRIDWSWRADFVTLLLWQHQDDFPNGGWAPVQDENGLLQRARALEKSALTDIHNRYYVAIYRYIAFRVGDAATAEDLTSEVFARFLRAIRDHHAPPNSLRGWLYGTASRVLKEHYRQKKQASFVPLSEGVPGKRPSPESQLTARQEEEALQAALQGLTAEQQEVLALRFGMGMPIREVAETMGKSEGSVKMLQTRAVAALTRLLGKQN